MISSCTTSYDCRVQHHINMPDILITYLFFGSVLALVFSHELRQFVAPCLIPFIPVIPHASPMMLKIRASVQVNRDCWSWWQLNKFHLFTFSNLDDRCVPSLYVIFDFPWARWKNKIKFCYFALVQVYLRKQTQAACAEHRTFSRGNVHWRSRRKHAFTVGAGTHSGLLS